MAIVNERERAGENSEQIFELTLTDQNAHDVPDLDGDDDPDGVGGEAFSVEGHDETVVKVVNNQDVGVNVTLEATNYEDSGFTEAYTVESGTTVASGSVDVFGENFNSPFDFYRLTVTAASAPNGNNEVRAAFINGD